MPASYLTNFVSSHCLYIQAILHIVTSWLNLALILLRTRHWSNQNSMPVSLENSSTMFSIWSSCFFVESSNIKSCIFNRWFVNPLIIYDKVIELSRFIARQNHSVLSESPWNTPVRNWILSVLTFVPSAVWSLISVFQLDIRRSRQVKIFVSTLYNFLIYYYYSYNTQQTRFSDYLEPSCQKKV